MNNNYVKTLRSSSILFSFFEISFITSKKLHSGHLDVSISKLKLKLKKYALEDGFSTSSKLHYTTSEEVLRIKRIRICKQFILSNKDLAATTT